MEDTELPTPIMISNMLVNIALETRHGTQMLRQHRDEVGQDADAKMMLISIPKETKLSIALYYLSSIHFGREDGGPIHLWAASLVLGKPIIALELAQNAPCIPGRAAAGAPYYTYYYPWQVEDAVVAQRRRVIDDPVALRLLRSR